MEALKCWIVLLLVHVSYCVSMAEYVTPPACKMLPELNTTEWGINRNLGSGVRYGWYFSYTTVECCAFDYDSLTWKFNGRRYPWFKQYPNNSSYNLSPLYGNQSLEIRRFQYEDRGSYTCILQKDNQTQSFTYILLPAVRSKDSNTALMINPPKNKTAAVGCKVTWNCEGYFGRTPHIFIPIVQWSVITETKLRVPVQFEHARYTEKVIRRNNNLNITSVLAIKEVQEDDYNVAFVCVVNQGRGRLIQNATVHVLKPNVQTEPYKKGLVAVGCLLVIIILITCLVWYYRLHVHIFLRETFSKSELIGDISHSAFLVYSEDSKDDSSFVTDTLLLEMERMGYSLLVSDRDFIPGSVRAEEYVRCMDTSARFVVILSPDFLKDTWCDFALNVALEQEKHIVFLVYRKIENWEEYNNQKLIKSILSIKQKLNWPSRETDRARAKFYRKLQLRLPNRRGRKSTRS